jgi:hypothetical protein
MAKARIGYAIALALAVALFLLSRTRQGQAVVAGATDSVMSSIRGVRLNNPLNIELGDPWQGLAPDQPDPRFAKFIGPEYGIRAAARVLMTYRGYGVNTIRKIIDRWNPIADGQPLHYVPQVSAALGLDQNAVIDVRDRATAFALLRAMMREEIGAAGAALVSDDTVHEGLTLAGIA